MIPALKKHFSVLIYLCGNRNKASSRVRGFWIAEALTLIGADCTLRWKQNKLDLIRFALNIPKHDAIIFQKTYSRYHRWLMFFANWLGKKTYIDFDDAPSRTQSQVTLNNIESMMRMVNGVFVGSQSLLEYAKQYQANVHLIPSGIKLNCYQVSASKSKDERVCLGWIGNGAHYLNDLVDILEEPLTKLAARYKLRFKLVGVCRVQRLYDSFGAIPGLEIDFIDEIEWSDPVRVSKAIQDFDIGLYPLLPNDFNKYKCGFKALEYMAIGIPVVSSPVAANAQIIDEGKDGLLAESKDNWVEALSKLIQNSELRQKMGQAGRRKVEKSFDVAIIANQLKTIMDHDQQSEKL